MACYHPLEAWRDRNGNVQFIPGGAVGSRFFLPCGQCIGCRLERSRQWAVRIMCEAQSHSQNCFITLTYNEENLPLDGGLRKRDFQLFMKRLRKRFPSKRIRFFHCGEYGENLQRPHYHAILFGVDFDDKEIFSNSRGNPLWTSAVLGSLWPAGFSTVGQLTFESAAYVARYVVKKVTGASARVGLDGVPGYYSGVDRETGEVVPIQSEYITMSLRDGIGADWFKKFSSDVFPSDQIVVRGVPQRPPRFFEKLHDQEFIEALKLKRLKQASRHSKERTPERLKARELVKSAQLSMLKRSL